MNVDFIIVGAQKCGTTTLFDILNSHPHLVGSAPKEPHFFTRRGDWRERVSEYERMFDQQPNARYFEASTSYTFYPLRKLGIWNDIHDYNPQMKLIYLVRRPIDRVISNYVHVYERSSRDMPIDDEVRRDRFYIDVTRYHTQIAPYIETFGREQVLILDFDDFIRERASVMQTVSSFLEIDFSLFGDFDAVHSNASGGEHVLQPRYADPSLPLKVVRRYLPAVWRRISDNSERLLSEKPKISAETAEMILNMLDLEISGMEELMGKDLSAWRVPTSVAE